MQITWEMILHIKDAIPSDGYINCDIDKNYTLVWTSERYTEPTTKQLEDEESWRANNAIHRKINRRIWSKE